jgi:hypothetical protein
MNIPARLECDSCYNSIVYVCALLTMKMIHRSGYQSVLVITCSFSLSSCALADSTHHVQHNNYNV